MTILKLSQPQHTNPSMYLSFTQSLQRLNIISLSLHFFLSPSSICQPPPCAVSVPTIPLSQQEVKVACALASALHSLCPSRSCSVNDKMNVPIPIIYLGNHMPVYYWVSLRNTYSNSFIPGNAKHSRLPKISG